MKRALTIACLLVPLSATVARAQSAPSDFIAYPKSLTDLNTFRSISNNTKTPHELTFNRMPGISPEYKMGPGDELDISVFGGPNPIGPIRVKIDGSGLVTLPLIGAVKVGDLTAEQAESAVAARFKEGQLITNAETLIYITEYESKIVYAMGQLDRPGEYNVSFDITLMDLIFIAGGVDFPAARYGYLHRRPSSQWRPTYAFASTKQLQEDLKHQPEVARPGEEVIQVDLQPMKDGKTLEPNYLLKNGDVFYIPERTIDLVYVIGDVVGPGAFEMPQMRKMTAARAISWAGGPTRTSKMSKGMIVRYDAAGQRHEQPIDFAAVLKGKQPDPEIRPNDIIFIPGSSGKLLAYGFVNAIPQLVASLIIF